MNFDCREALLLTQLRLGYARLGFIPDLEPEFAKAQLQQVLERLPLITWTVLLLQAVFLFLEWLLQPLETSSALLPLRLLAIFSALGALWYCRSSSHPAPTILRVYVSAYAIHGLCMSVLVHISWLYGGQQDYDCLFLVMMFGYLWLGGPLLMVSLSSLLFCAVFVGLYPLMGWDLNAGMLYEAIFLFGANVIGTIGAYSREYEQRKAWLNTQLLDLARLRAEDDDGRKLRLLAAASHDLRQPLNAMGLYVEHLLEHNQDPSVRHISQRLAVAVEQLGRLMLSLLDFTRLTLPDGVRPQIEHFALRPLLLRLSHEAQAQAKSQGIELQLQCSDLWVHSDPLLLERVLRNLLINALLHAQAKRVWLYAGKNDDGEVEVEVGDDGRGLAEDEQVLVFEEFRQLNNPGRKAERGLGLGLAIVDQLLQALGHRLQLHSEPGHGARFVVQLPVGKSAQHPVPAAKPRPLQGRVLLIEDDVDSLNALTTLLQGWGCHVWACRTLAEAQVVFEQSQAQVLISDFRLAEDNDGLFAIRALRERGGAEIPALLVSADVSVQLQARCVEESVTLLAKPLLPARLQQTLVVLLGVHRPATASPVPGQH
ncbi:hybrid sensor histidine kinase/response regulator [Pseudomonas sp. 5P_3.1_Bac2]|uniref:hybrid sensor histidine kinase/response regulator n=1 Tax=Pseudomonas sp. 5P_3.1_Bac2 TaxID=2971617 RepID=UPI0021C6ED11|nr:hybrid sensor histidine kinase/response regulator [Pseudomonas sp. 5P_3.1_Bac2]MCU1716256.1 hybrid sensor histidine kinase/response regulator [Pseudomonas sp. 5P_3.1_Bac2]